MLVEAVRSGLQEGGSVIAITPEWIGRDAIARVAMVRSMLDTHRLALHETALPPLAATALASLASAAAPHAPSTGVLASLLPELEARAARLHLARQRHRASRRPAPSFGQHVASLDARQRVRRLLVPRARPSTGCTATGRPSRCPSSSGRRGSPSRRAPAAPTGSLDAVNPALGGLERAPRRADAAAGRRGGAPPSWSRRSPYPLDVAARSSASWSRGSTRGRAAGAASWSRARRARCAATAAARPAAARRSRGADAALARRRQPRGRLGVRVVGRRPRSRAVEEAPGGARDRLGERDRRRHRRSRALRARRLADARPTMRPLPSAPRSSSATTRTSSIRPPLANSIARGRMPIRPLEVDERGLAGVEPRAQPAPGRASSAARVGSGSATPVGLRRLRGGDAVVDRRPARGARRRRAAAGDASASSAAMTGARRISSAPRSAPAPGPATAS